MADMSMLPPQQGPDLNTGADTSGMLGGVNPPAPGMNPGAPPGMLPGQDQQQQPMDQGQQSSDPLASAPLWYHVPPLWAQLIMQQLGIMGEGNVGDQSANGAPDMPDQPDQQAAADQPGIYGDTGPVPDLGADQTAQSMQDYQNMQGSMPAPNGNATSNMGQANIDSGTQNFQNMLDMLNSLPQYQQDQQGGNQ